MIGGNVVNSFFCNFIKGEMKIKSIKILKTSYFVRLSVIPVSYTHLTLPTKLEV